MHLGLISSRSEKAVDRNGGRVFRKDCFVKGLRPPKAALRALDKTILSKLWLAVAIDGVTRRAYDMNGRSRTMDRMKIRAASVLAVIAATALTAAVALAQAPAYPTRPLTLVVPYPAGSAIGTRDVARAAPNGYTILIATSSLAINPSLYPDADYDPKKDFAPIGLIATSANLVLVRPSLPAHSLADLIALAKAAPGKLNFASTGTGTSTHLAALLFAGMAGVTLTAIPYKGVAPAVTDLLGEHVDLMFCPTASVIGLVQQGKVRALAGNH